MRDQHLVCERKQIAIRPQIAITVGSARGDSSNRTALYEPRDIHRSAASKEIRRARKSERQLIDDIRSKDVRLAQAGDLASKCQIHEAERIYRGSIGNAIVDGINSRKSILVGESLIEPRGSKIF